MKSIILVICGLLIFASGALAADSGGPDVTNSEALTLGGNDDNASTVLIGLSPKVVAHYFTDGADDETAQWYAISTVHPGGNIAYGTSQDVNNIYMKWYVTGTTVADTVDNVPAERDAVVDADTGLGGGWTDLEWSLTPPMGPPE